MEKLSLEMLTSEEVLGRSQKKKITGGYVIDVYVMGQ